jgi:cytochrome c peroxidase
MTRVLRRTAYTCAAVISLLLAVSGGLGQNTAFNWNIPAPFPRPQVPADNEMNPAKAELGRRLFYDKRMSVNGTESCASCHRQELAFTDGRPRAEGATGEKHPRSSMSLANVAYNPSLTWANPFLGSLEDQAKIPMYGTAPVELGLKGNEDHFLAEVRVDRFYRELFRQAFAGDNAPYTMDNVVKAIAAFERTLISVNSPFDRYKYGNDPDAISDSAKRGEVLFFSGEKTACFQCHEGWNFSGALRYEGGRVPRTPFHNTGLYNLDGELSYPSPNTGLYEITHRPADVGRFRVPTLRNIAVTAPYMHDGTIDTLPDVLDHYAAGGRTIASGPHAGIGRENPNKSPNVRGFMLSEAEKKDLIAFLDSLTDSEFLHNPAFSDPWK